MLDKVAWCFHLTAHPITIKYPNTILMEITNGTVVSMDYALRNDEGTIIDQSQPEQPLTYLHGHKNIIPGLESALAGKSAGDEVDVRVSPEDGYGEKNPALEQVVPKDRFQGIENIEEGMQFQASTDQGPVSVRVVKVEDEVVTVDGNHPLAGVPLNFKVTVKDVRTASEEELAHGHVHQSGGCCGGNGDGGEGCCGGGGGDDEGCGCS